MFVLISAVVQYTSNFSGWLKQYFLLFSGIGALFCHRFYCFHSQLCEPFSEVPLDPISEGRWTQQCIAPQKRLRTALKAHFPFLLHTRAKKCHGVILSLVRILFFLFFSGRKRQCMMTIRLWVSNSLNSLATSRQLPLPCSQISLFFLLLLFAMQV